MPPKPNINNLKLKRCCVESLREINEITESGRLLRAFLPASIFASMLGGGPIDVAFSVATSDWDLMADATRSVPIIVRSRCRDIATLEAISHNEPDLARFWTAMEASFND